MWYHVCLLHVKEDGDKLLVNDEIIMDMMFQVHKVVLYC